MAKKKSESATPSAAVTVTQETLDATPARVVKFLRGVGTVPAIRAALAAAGYTDEDHEEGWTRLHAASGYSATNDFATATDTRVHAAIATLDAWDEDGFRIVRAALSRLHPKQAAAVLDGIGPHVGAEAVVGVSALLDRIDALAKSKDKADHAAVATLETRGITKEKREELRALVNVAEKGAAPAKVDPNAQKNAKAEAEKHVAALASLYAWFSDWSEMARATIKRRDRLIRLGLATRKVPSKAAPPGAAPPPPSPVPSANHSASP